jgi:hypothetical protein
MPLAATNLEQAKEVYSALEERTQAAEWRVTTLEQSVGELQAVSVGQIDHIRLLKQRILDIESHNLKLQTQVQQVAQATTDMLVSEFAQMTALSVEIAEAVMPDRSVISLTSELKSYLLPQQGAFGVRLPQPELSIEPGELSSTSIQLAKVPPPAGSPASSKSLYLVLVEKQAMYGAPRWSGSKAAAALVSGIVGILTDTGDWGGTAIPRAAAAVATLELAFADELGGASSPSGLAQYRALATDCQTLARGIVARAKLVPGDVRAVTSALDQTTTLAQTWQA